MDATVLTGLQADFLAYAGVALTAVITLATFGAAFRVVPRVIRIISNKVAA